MGAWTKIARLARLAILAGLLGLSLPAGALEPPRSPEPESLSLREPYDPFFEPEWAVSLRGGYVSDSNGGRFETVIAPNLNLTHQGVRSDLTLSAGGELTRSTQEDWRVNSLRLAVGTDYALSSLTTLSGDVNLSLNQPSQFDASPSSNVLRGATTLTGAAEGAMTRDLGRTNFSLRGTLGRTLYGPSTLKDLSTLDNSSRNFTSAGAGFRLGVEITPLITLFGDASVARDLFDQTPPPPSFSANANTFALRGGLAYERGTTLSAEASIGVGMRRFDDDAVAQVTATLYDASLTYRPTATWALTAGFATTIAPPGPEGSGTARVQYAANFTSTYKLNRYIALRTLANWRTAQFTGSTNTESGYGLGVGVDYLINRQVRMSADYAFSHTEAAPDPAEDDHRVTLGVTFSR